MSLTTSNTHSFVHMNRLFGRAISFVGKDYFCHVLWDKYMKYEFNQEGWSFLAQSYIQVLRFPTKKLQFYYDKYANLPKNSSPAETLFQIYFISLRCSGIK